jgi:hypothetical protein
MLTFFYFWAVKQLFGTCNQILKKGNGQLREKKNLFSFFASLLCFSISPFIFASPFVDDRNNPCYGVTVEH